MAEITKDTRLSGILTEYPWLKEKLVEVNDRFKLLNTPVGNGIMGKATIAEMSRKSGMDADVIISKVKELILNHQ